MQPQIRFGSYRFDLATERLWSGAEELRLTPKASAVLKVLLTRAGTTVAKEELFAAVWKGTAVGDDALTSCVQELRRAFADDARQPRFIETRHRRGYQFIAALDHPSPDASAAAPAADAMPADGTAAPAAPAIAVLPFADMSPRRDQDYLCEGLAEELINALTHIDGLRVASRTASFQFRSSGADVRAVGQHLGVQTLLEGSVRKAGDRLRVTVQLIDVASGYHRWSQRFDQRLDDVFAMQDAIAESVATSLRGGALSDRERQGLQRPQTDATAYEYYLRARQLLPQMTHPSLTRTAALFQQAIDLDAGYGPALAGLAMVYATLYEWFGGKPEDLQEAERSSLRALELAPDLAEAHVARGFVLSLTREPDRAPDEFEEAIRINPNLFDAYYYYARASFARGDIARSAQLFGQAAEVRQEDYQSAMLQGQSLRMLGRAGEALTAIREGIRRAERMLRLNPHDGRALSLGSGALYGDGQIERAIEWSTRALELYPDDASALFNGACLRAKLGQKEEALALLERVFARGWGKRGWLENDPDYDGLRDDPRFQKLLERLK